MPGNALNPNHRDTTTGQSFWSGIDVALLRVSKGGLFFAFWQFWPPDNGTDLFQRWVQPSVEAAVWLHSKPRVTGPGDSANWGHRWTGLLRRGLLLRTRISGLNY